MGQAMAGRLRAAGHDLLVYDPVPGQTAELEAAGASAVGSPAAASADRDIVISMLPSDKALDDVVNGDGGLIQNMSGTCVHMASGTHGVPAIVAAENAHCAVGQRFVACPVLGRPDLAAEGLIKLVPAGPSDAVDVARPLFEALAQHSFEAGASPRAAAAVKIANNLALGCAIEAMGEAFSLVEKLGVEPQLFYEVMTQGLFAATAYEVYGKIIVDQNWDSHGATATVGLKDADLALEAGRAARVPLPSAAIWRDHLLRAIERGEGHLDWAVMAREQARASGLEK